MSDTVLLDNESEETQEIVAPDDDVSSEIEKYASNLQLASSSELHQDLLFYEIQFDSLLNRVVESEEIATEKGDLEKAALAQIVASKIRAVEEEIERRKRNSR